MTRGPTVGERLRFLWTFRRPVIHRHNTAAVLNAALSQSFAAALGRPVRPVRDPSLCPDCPHSRGWHTNRPAGYGCVECLCLTLP